MSTPLQNWSRTLTYQAARVHRPTTTAALQTVVRSTQKLRFLGTRHAFNPIGDTTEDLVLMEGLATEIFIDPRNRTVTVDGGTTYGQLCPLLDAAGFALANLASLPHISIAGAITTATHGSGERNGNLATSVAALEYIGADGSIHSVARSDGEQFNGVVVNLGALGPITKITLAIEPKFEVSQRVYEHIPLEAAIEHFDEIQALGYSVSFFTDWRSDTLNQIWIKSKVKPGEKSDAPAEVFGAIAASTKLHPIRSVNAENCTDQLGVPGPWFQRLPHFKLEFTPSQGEEIQSEYFVSRADVGPALRALSEIKSQISPILLIAEIRTIAADQLWMSPCYQQDSVAFHFTWEKRWPEVERVLPVIEAALAPFSPRPHWAKTFKLSPELIRARIPRFDEFRSLTRELDPDGKFRNEFLSDLLG